jgi:hypothetical protein
VRMDADSSLHRVRMALGERERRLGRGDVPARDEYALDSSGDGALDDIVPIGVEACVLQMRVRIHDPGQPLRPAATAQAVTSSSIRGNTGTAVPVLSPSVCAPHARSSPNPGPPAPRSSYGGDAPS